MARKAIALGDMSIAQLKKLLAARENVEALRARRAAILSELAKLDREIGRVQTSWGRKPGRPVGARAGRKKAAKRETPTQIRKAGARARAGKGAGKPTIEDVVVKVLGRRQMAFPDILAKIQKDKLVATKSKNSFDLEAGRASRAWNPPGGVTPEP